MIQLVFQNHNFAVCNKPAQVLSVPAREKNDARPCLGLALQKELKTQIFPVHRLDYEVSGLIIYALNAKAHRLAQDWFIKRQIKKYYSALTSLQDFSHWPQNITTDRNTILAQAGTRLSWKTQILRGKKRSFESPNGEWAHTEAEITSVSGDSPEKVVHWHLYPVTGKPHQLRLELSRHGFPIHGDTLYGSKVKFSKGIALQAYELDLSTVAERMGLPEKIQIEDLQP